MCSTKKTHKLFGWVHYLKSTLQNKLVVEFQIPTHTSTIAGFIEIGSEMVKIWILDFDIFWVLNYSQTCVLSYGTYIRLGKTGSLGPRRRVILHHSKPSLYQNDCPMQCEDHFGIVKASYDAPWLSSKAPKIQFCPT